MRGSMFVRVTALRRASLVLTIVAASAVARPLTAETIDFSERPLNTSVDGQVVDGVTFKFTINNVPSPDARFSTTGPGPTTITAPPNLEGNTAGVLSLGFGTPVRDVGFSYIALHNLADPNGLTVTMTDVNGTTTSQDLAIARIGAYSGVRFDHVATVPIVRLSIDPNRGTRFAVDNVTFTPVPEPAALLPLTGGALLLRRRARRA